MDQECVREQYVARADEDAQRRDTGKIGMFRAQLGVIEGAIRRVPPPCLLGREQCYAGRLRLATVAKFLRDT
ncbi:Uncharacterised protein [Mycobacteroides abscessus subsp. abscessus]|nr:Uncharacterised protein [Mycobacteroides abscessus subsp. abscessus]